MKEKRRLLWVDKDPSLYSSNYIGMFDLTKGLIMVEIILSHCINDYLNLLLYDGGDNILVQLFLSPLTLLRYGPVPMLFMICGYGVRRQRIKKCIKNHIKIFLFPYLCVMIGVLIFVFIKWGLFGVSLVGRLVQQVLPFLFGFHPGAHLLGDSLEQIGPVWFVFTYIFGSIYLNFVLQAKQSWVQVFILSAGTAVALILVGLPLPFCLQQILICSGFMYVGMALKREKVPQQKLPLYIVLIIYLICTVSTELGGLAEIGNNVYRFGGIDLILAYLAGVVLLCLHQRLNVLQGVIADGLRWIGRHMMWFCCVHTISYLAVPWKKIGAYFGNYPLIGLLVEILTSFAFAILGCILIEVGIKKRIAKKRASRKDIISRYGD